MVKVPRVDLHPVILKKLRAVAAQVARPRAAATTNSAAMIRLLAISAKEPTLRALFANLTVL